MTTSWVGLAAETWDCLGGDAPQADVEWFRALVEAQQGLALDVGCGTGRVLVRLLRAGLAAHGVDTSVDMLTLCRAKAKRYGFEPKLFHQRMEALDLPARYATILVPCGSFTLLLDDASALAALRRFRRHLAPGGAVALTFLAPFDPPAPVLGRWTRRAAGALPDGSEVTMDVIVDRYDAGTRVVESRRRYTVVRAGAEAREALLVDRYRWYDVASATRLVEQAGFDPPTATGDFTAEPVAAGHGVLVLLARERD